MYNSILEILRPNIENLPFVAQHVGVVEPVAIQTGENTFITVPVCCGQNLDDCINDIDRLQHFFIGEHQKGVSCFEVKEGIDIKEHNEFVDTYEITGKAKMIVFVNLRLLGFEQCSIDALVTMSVLNALNGTYSDLQSPFQNGSLQVEVNGMSKNRNEILEAYDIPQYLHLYPFEFFAFDVNFVLAINKNCFQGFPILEPLLC